MRDHRVFKIVKALGKQVGLAQLRPHAFRHSCGVELLRRTRGNLRAVQEHLRHSAIQTTTLYTRLTQDELQRVVSVFDRSGEQKKDSRPFTAGLELEGKNTINNQGGDPGGIRHLWPRGKSRTCARRLTFCWAFRRLLPHTLVGHVPGVSDSCC